MFKELINSEDILKRIEGGENVNSNIGGEDTPWTLLSETLRGAESYLSVLEIILQKYPEADFEIETFLGTTNSEIFLRILESIQDILEDWENNSN